MQAWASEKKETALPTMEFQRKLVEKMMTDRLGDNGVAAASPVRTRARVSNDHVLSKRAKKRENGITICANSMKSRHCTSPVRAPFAT